MKQLLLPWAPLLRASARRVTTCQLVLLKLFIVLLAVVAFGCGSDSKSEDPGRLVIALTTDMEVPKDITRVTVDVREGDTPETGKQLYTTELSGESLALPATLPVDVGKGKEVPVAVRVTAWQGQADSEVLRVVSDRQTTVPAQGRVVLEVPLEWLCDGFGRGQPGGVSSACPSGHTCIAGRCESNWVDPSTLPAYEPGLLGAEDECFDGAGCFAGTELSTDLEVATCTLPAPSSVEVGINVAMVLTSGDGACSSERCFIVLDGFSTRGWSKQGDKLQLPPAVCDRVASQQVKGIAMTTTCPTKTWSLPLCPYRTGAPTSADAGVAGSDPGNDNSGDGEPEPKTCPAEQHNCLGVCVSNTSAATCGESCDACPAPENGSATCDGTTCGIRCDAGYHSCGDRCVSDASSASCGESCTECAEPDHGSARCSSSACSFVCDDGYHACGDECVHDASTAACGESCTPCSAPKNASPVCDDGTCDFVCASGYHRCGEQCRRNKSVKSCGSSCSPCPEPDNGSATCDGSSCGFKCDTGYHKCGSKCVSNSSVNSCGSSCSKCPVPDNGSATCDGSSCGFKCDTGYHKCGSKCVSNSSVNSCGSSCSKCPEPSNGSATCDGSSCGFTCNSGYHKCGSSCVSNSSVNSCGSSCSPCPDPANGSPTCNGSSCGISCDTGYHQCGSQCLSNSSVNSCGSSCSACTAPSNASPTCNGTSCGFSCNSGYYKCGSGCRTTPVGTEICDGIDNDCDGSTDELSCTHSGAVECFLFNDGYANLAGPYDAIRIAGANSMCASDGTCRRWFGRCRTKAAADGHVHQVQFDLANSGGANSTALTDAIFFNGSQFCMPGGASGVCRSFIANGIALSVQNHTHKVLTRVFNDGYASMSAAGWIHASGLSSCMGGTCRKWQGRWQIQ